MRPIRPLSSGLPSRSTAGKRPGRSFGAGPAINLVEDPVHPRPKIEIELRGIGMVESLVDTGAFKTVASAELIDRVNLEMRSDNRRFLRALGGFSVGTLGVVDLSTDFKGRGN